MPDWIHQLARDWGHHMRRAEAEASQVQGTLGRVAEEGPVAAAIRTLPGPRIPLPHWPKPVKAFHLAWLKLDEPHRRMLFIDYKLRLAHREKFKLAGLKKDAYYRARNRAKIQIAGQLDSRIRK